MPVLLIKLLELIIPPLIQAVINHYEKKEQTPEVVRKLQAHQAACKALEKPNVVQPPSKSPQP